jgi:hypothetical protein
MDSAIAGAHDRASSISAALICTTLQPSSAFAMAPSTTISSPLAFRAVALVHQRSTLPRSRGNANVARSSRPPAWEAARTGRGRFCSASCRSGSPPSLATCAQCGTEFKVWAYRLRDAREGSLAAGFCRHSCWMRFNWKHGIAVSDAMVPLATSGRFRQKMKAKWAGPKGASHGIKGGRPVETTPEERQKMLECLNAGLSQRQTAIAVFGDAKYRKRVRSFIGS